MRLRVATLLFILSAAVAPAAAGEPSGAALDQACAGRDGWSDAAPPARLFGNTYYVGTCGITVLLVTSARGHVLVDTGPADAAPFVLANIRALGFDPRDVRLILGSHEHVDHLGGAAPMKAATGARFAARAPARATLESGRASAADPQAGLIVDAPPVVVDRVVRDGETVRVGGLALTAVATPGHTDGGTSWSWKSCEGARCLDIAYVDSLAAVSRDGYRFADHPERVAPFRSTFARVAAMRCDVLATPHPGASRLFARMAGREPLVDGGACARLAQTAEAALDARLARETNAAAGGDGKR